MRGARVVVLCVMVFATGCRKVEIEGEVHGVNTSAMPDKQVIASVACQRIFFGHQSVGHNILEGVGMLAPELPVVEIQGGRLSQPGLYHASIGRNTDPVSKIDAFRKILDSGLGGTADVALMKLCYVDIRAGADVPVLFKRYSEATDAIKKQYPKLRVMHCTVPLTCPHESMVVKFKRLMGKSLPALTDNADNAARAAFNSLMLSGYGADVFDIASIESQGIAGLDPYTCMHEGRRIQSMDPNITTDGGHLNDRGKRLVAGAFLAFLAKYH